MPATLPPYAYVPGQTPRHDSVIFVDLHRSVRAGMTIDELQSSAAFDAGRRFLQAGFYWEAHEAFEPVWMQLAPGSCERSLVQALIQIANAALKARMNRPRAVRRLCDIAQDHLNAAGAGGGAQLMGVEFDQMARQIARIRSEAADPDD